MMAHAGYHVPTQLSLSHRRTTANTAQPWEVVELTRMRRLAWEVQSIDCATALRRAKTIMSLSTEA